MDRRQNKPGCAGEIKIVNSGGGLISAAFHPMKKENSNPDDAKLRSLLLASRVSPSLPPRFQENVWRRIADAEAPAASETWLDALAALILRPRFAFATASVLLFAGVFLGAHEGFQTVRHDAQTRYLAAVAPDSLR